MNFYNIIDAYNGERADVFDGSANGRVIKEVREFHADMMDVDDEELIISFLFEDGGEIQIAATCGYESASTFTYIRGPIGKEVVSTKIVNYRISERFQCFEFNVLFNYEDGTSLDVEYETGVDSSDIYMQWIEPEEKEGWRPLQRGEDGSILEHFRR